MTIRHTCVVILRDEHPGDDPAITEVTVAAFNTLAISGHTEQFIIHALRAAGALTLSIVAEEEDREVGHIAFPPVSISDGTPGWYGLGPVSVLPNLHRRGIGKALVLEGLDRLRALGALGCVLVGDPEYYGRSGFRPLPDLVLEGVPPEVFLGLPFGKSQPRGKVAFHPAFSAKE